MTPSGARAEPTEREVLGRGSEVTTSPRRPIARSAARPGTGPSCNVCSRNATPSTTAPVHINAIPTGRRTSPPPRAMTNPAAVADSPNATSARADVTKPRPERAEPGGCSGGQEPEVRAGCPLLAHTRTRGARSAKRASPMPETSRSSSTVEKRPWAVRRSMIRCPNAGPMPGRVSELLETWRVLRSSGPELVGGALPEGVPVVGGDRRDCPDDDLLTVLQRPGKG